jgi:hypothetical protein
MGAPGGAPRHHRAGSRRTWGACPESPAGVDRHARSHHARTDPGPREGEARVLGGVCCLSVPEASGAHGPSRDVSPPQAPPVPHPSARGGCPSGGRRPVRRMPGPWALVVGHLPEHHQPLLALRGHSYPRWYR